MTLRRIRTFMDKWKGQPVGQVPFGLHAIKYLMAVVEGEVTPGDEPYDAPWMGNVDPKDFQDWRPDYAPGDPPVKYTEQDRMLHNAVEVTGPIEPPVDDGFGQPGGQTVDKTVESTASEDEGDAMEGMW